MDQLDRTVGNMLSDEVAINLHMFGMLMKGGIGREVGCILIVSENHGGINLYFKVLQQSL